MISVSYEVYKGIFLAFVPFRGPNVLMHTSKNGLGGLDLYLDHAAHVLHI